MNENRKFGKLEGGVIKFAPRYFVTDNGIILNPSAEQYLERGWLPIVDDQPTTDAKHYAIATGWREVDGKIERIYDVREIVKPPRRWTPLAIKRAAKERGWWEQLRTALVAADLLEDFWGAQFIAEDDPDYPTIKGGMDALFGDKEVVKFLATVPQEV